MYLPFILTGAEHMKMHDFIIHEPDNIGEAIRLLSAFGAEARIIAGGTDLVVDLKQHNIEISHLVSVGKIGGLSEITAIGDELRIGALVSLDEVAENILVKNRLMALSEAAFSMASKQIRNQGTIGGNIASAVPSADLPPALIAAGAYAVIAGENGERKIPMDLLFLGPRKTAIAEGEILTHVMIPYIGKNTGISYKKFKLRGANALAVASVASSLTMEGNTIKEGRIVLGAVAPVPLIAELASEMLAGKVASGALFSEVAMVATGESKPISDIRGSREYRNELIRVLAEQSLHDAFMRATGGGD